VGIASPITCVSDAIGDRSCTGTSLEKTHRSIRDRFSASGARFALETGAAVFWSLRCRQTSARWQAPCGTRTAAPTPCQRCNRHPNLSAVHQTRTGKRLLVRHCWSIWRLCSWCACRVIPRALPASTSRCCPCLLKANDLRSIAFLSDSKGSVIVSGGRSAHDFDPCTGKQSSFSSRVAMFLEMWARLACGVMVRSSDIPCSIAVETERLCRFLTCLSIRAE